MSTQDETRTGEPVVTHHDPPLVAHDESVYDELVEDAPSIDQRDRRLEEGADRLTTANRSILAHPRFLMAVSATLMTIGVTAILLAWAGASRSTFVEEQIPYLISGGLLGVALAIVGALLLFTHWLTTGIREARAHEADRRADHAELMAGLDALTDVLIRQEANNGSTRGAGAQRPLRAAPRR